MIKEVSIAYIQYSFPIIHTKFVLWGNKIVETIHCLIKRMLVREFM